MSGRCASPGSGALRRVPGDQQRVRADGRGHGLAKHERHDCRWLAERIAMRVEELDVEFFATAFESDQQKAGLRPVTLGGADCDCVKAGDAE